ncbi:MAG: hypothetical protein ACI3WR_03890 [Oscillospiraceae bacterium]
MKKRVCSALVLLCLLLTLCGAALDGQAATVYFTASNDTLLELSDDTMPFWSGSQLYVPVSAFSSGGLGISDSYNVAKKTLTLRRSSFRLICNLSSGMTVDSDGNVYEFTALEKGGVLFLPINPVCRIFSLSCSTRSVPNGYLVRIRNENAVFSDEAFIANASAMLASRYASYEAAKRGTEGPSSQEPDGETEETGRVLYLGFTVRSAEAAQRWLEACSGTAHHATFFLTEEFFQDDGEAAAEAVRRVLSEGHSLGLAGGDGGAAQALAALRSGNEALQRMACVKTRLAYLPQGAAETAEKEGYCPVGFDLSCAGETELSSSAISRLLNGAGTAARLELGDSLSASSLRLLLSRAADRGYTGQCFRETAY